MRDDSDRLVHPSDYFPHCPSTFTSSYITRHGNDVSPNTVCSQVIGLLRGWLNFPSNSELLSAYFVLHLVDVCGGNADILLLRGVWRPYKEMKASILNVRGQRWSNRQCGLHALVEFFYNILPLARGKAPMTSIQQLVASDMDHYLPFRNLAPTRRRASSPSGPFHPTNILRPGAFASCVINRALTFNTPASRDEGNPTLFKDEEAWNKFKAERHFVEKDKQSLKYFFNATCYGSAQYTRYQGMKDVWVYFAVEGDWEELRSTCGGIVPFLQFIKWAKQQIKRTDKQTGKSRPQSRLPLIGKLTALLLAADLTYSGVVKSPTVEEVGAVIYQNGLGSRAGLVESGQISSEGASKEEVIAAFAGVVRHLQANVSDEDQAFVGLDSIMVKHLLCKYQRVQRDLLSFKGKGVAR
ncbi:hypothetical protein L227DRAFT_512154 [Lentinus tigrinus ALCF2SS1-6]|uniref:Uncharacterized protein n=1 Tax=Lentinus tigrinus ALCF2SS1-6 TaxID=1328759 RepID=A0A5C2RR82_9APHY|nr:hypothetical protein L227DRAFT_512154 [Lentinus tigrinus ALCF2SS1-6]